MPCRGLISNNKSREAGVICEKNKILWRLCNGLFFPGGAKTDLRGQGGNIADKDRVFGCCV